ncbi:MAG: hypothetical protein WC718_02425 [Phycisphaerales bacterium]|jgi:hypothetical protein
MRSRVRSWLVIVPVVLLALLMGGGIFLYGAFGGVAVSAAGTTLTIRNSGLVIRNAQITVFDHGSTMKLSVASLPAGTTTLLLPSAVTPNTYEGACIEGSRLGGSVTWYFATTESISSGPVANVTESSTDISVPGPK